MGMADVSTLDGPIIPNLTEHPPEGDESEDEESDNESDSELFLPSATTPSSASSPTAPPRCRSDIQELRAKVRQVQESQQAIQSTLA